jgi:hypothetical protein
LTVPASGTERRAGVRLGRTPFEAGEAVIASETEHAAEAAVERGRGRWVIDPGRFSSLRRLCVLAPVLLAALAFVSTATASQLIDVNATEVRLSVNARGQALLSYRAGGQLKHVLAWGAVNALRPTRGREQVKFSLDLAGGGSFDGVCLPYTGPPLAWKVAACRAPDGSYWAVQSWQRALPDYGVKATPEQAARELRLSHWTGGLPVLRITTDWVYRRFDHLFGTFTYDGSGVYGFSATPYGAPLDSFGRNVYVDAYNSPLGHGWVRDNSFLTHRPQGSFCYGFYPHAGHPAATGERYRATVIGPGVTPDVMWEGRSPGSYDANADAAANEQQLALHDPSCKAG